MGERELTFEERTLWGRCPVCDAEHGVACNREVSLPQSGVVGGVNGEIIGAHYGRLSRAPYVVIDGKDGGANGGKPDD